MQTPARHATIQASALVETRLDTSPLSAATNAAQAALEAAQAAGDERQVAWLEGVIAMHDYLYSVAAYVDGAPTCPEASYLRRLGPMALLGDGVDTLHGLLRDVLEETRS